MIVSELFLEGFDLDAIAEREKATGSRRLKRDWIEKGYTHQLSFYSALKRKRDGETWGVRIEVHSRTPYTKDDLEGLYKLFSMATPSFAYSIWIFDSDPWSLKLRGSYEKTWSRR
jgi:hypothetical protein